LQGYADYDFHPVKSFPVFEIRLTTFPVSLNMILRTFPFPSGGLSAEASAQAGKVGMGVNLYRKEDRKETRKIETS
jgi:hypothetical protein